MIVLLPLAVQAPSRVETYVVEGNVRQALVFPGTGSAPKEGRPLILAFHGHGGGMAQAARSFGLQNLWPEATVIYPQGLPTKGITDPAGMKAGWQQNPGDSGDRDLEFVDKILEDAKGYDKTRVYAMGHSNGGRMTYLLWSARGARFAAYGPSSSPGVLLVRRARPAPAFVVAGETDPIVPFASQKATIDAIARLDDVDAAKATKKGYLTLTPGKGGTELGTYVHPGGHVFLQESAKAMIELFKRHSLPTTTSRRALPVD